MDGHKKKDLSIVRIGQPGGRLQHGMMRATNSIDSSYCYKDRSNSESSNDDTDNNNNSNNRQGNNNTTTPAAGGRGRRSESIADNSDVLMIAERFTLDKLVEEKRYD